MRNFVQDGDRVDLVAPRALNPGDGVQVGKIFAVSAGSAAQGDTFTAYMEGVFDLPKLGTDVVAQGDDLWWDDANHQLTATAHANLYAGKAVAAAGAGIATVRVDIGCGGCYRPTGA